MSGTAPAPFSTWESVRQPGDAPAAAGAGGFSGWESPPEPKPVTPAGTMGGMGRNFLTGIPEGIASLADMIDNMGILGKARREQAAWNGIRGNPAGTDVPPGFADLVRHPRKFGVDVPGTGDVPSHGAGERIARAFGQGVGSAAMPMPGAGLAGNAVNVGANAVGMGVGQAAAELAPEKYQPLVAAAVSLPVSLAAGKMGDMAVSGVNRAGTALGAAGIGAKPVIGETGAPIVGTAGPIQATQTQLERVGEKLRGAADVGVSEVAGPPAMGVAPSHGAFEGPVEPTPLIPPAAGGAVAAQEALAAPGSDIAGVQRTTAQQTQNTGLTALEGTYRQAFPGQFNKRAAGQSEAMQGAIGALAPDRAVAASPGRFVADLARQLDDAEGMAAAGAAPIQQRTGAMGGYASPEAQGSNIRAAVETARKPEKAAASAPWEMLKADTSLAVNLDPMFDMVKKLAGGQSPTASSVPGMSDAYGFIAASLKNKPTVTFQQLSDLMRDTAAMERSFKNDPKIGPESPAMHLLGEFKQSLYDSIAHTVDITNAREATQVALGAMRPEETLAARLDAETLHGAGQQTASGVADGAVASEGAAGVPGGQYPAAGGDNVSGVSGAPRSGGAAGNRGVAGAPAAEALTPNLPQAAADLYAEARPKYAKYKETYRTGPVGEILQPGPSAGTYRITNADAVRRFFDGGVRTPEQVKKLAEAMGGLDKVQPIAREVLAWQLRRANVIGQDGMIDATRFSRWARDNGPTLDLFPALKREFGEAGAAQSAYDATMARVAQTKKDFQKSAAAYFLSRNPNYAGLDPAQSVAQAFRDGPQAFRAIDKMLAPNPDAAAGWKAAVTDYMTSRFRSARPATEGADFIKSGEFRKFIDQNRESLKAVYGGQGLNRLEAVEGELRRQAYSAQAGTGSPTTQYLIGAKGENLVPGDAGQTTLLALIGAELAQGAAGAAGGMAPVAGAAAATMAGNKFKSLRQHGIDSMNALVMEALLNPHFAKVAMQKVPAQAEYNPAWARRLGAALVAGKAADDRE